MLPLQSRIPPGGIWYHDYIMHSDLVEESKHIGIQAVGAAPAAEEVRPLFPWAVSVVSAAVSYFPPEPVSPPTPTCGLVARVARGADYHEVVRAKLDALADRLEQGYGVSQYEIHVDTSPLPERKIALLCGVGWLGNNGCVFVEGYGSYVALGEIIVDKALDVSGPGSQSLCGACRRCIDACPTGALSGRGVVDKSRCLSHLTQAGGIAPREIRTALGSRIYGCDVCQEVCPHNSGLAPVNPEFIQQRFPGAHPDLLPLLNLSKADFESRIRPSAIGWIGRSRLRRNAALAVGNLGLSEAVPQLREMLVDPSSVVRSGAAWALGRIGTAEALDSLKFAVRSETNIGVIEEISFALKK